MFYIKDLFFRVFYSLYTFSTVIILLFLKKEILLALINNNLTKNFFDYTKNIFITITYNSPIDLLIIYFYIIIFFSFLLLLPYLLWLVFDFYKSSLSSSTYMQITYMLIFSLIIFLIIITIFFFLFLPLVWQFFEKTNAWIEKTSYLTFFQQLQFDKYFLFIKNFMIIFFYFYLFMLFLILISFKFKFNLLLTYRKFFLVVNIVVATFISPPDIFSQLCLFFLFTCMFEILCLFFLTLLKYLKNLFIFNFIKVEKN